VLRSELTQTASELNARQTELAASQADVRKLHSDLQEKSKKVCDLEERLDGLEAKSSGLLQGLSSQTEETEAKKYVWISSAQYMLTDGKEYFSLVFMFQLNIMVGIHCSCESEHLTSNFLLISGQVSNKRVRNLLNFIVRFL